MSNINSFIENLPKCKNNKRTITPSCNSTNINCPELTSEQLDNFCYNDSNCKVICPKDVDLTKNLIPNENNSSFIDNISETFTSIVQNYYNSSLIDNISETFTSIFLIDNISETFTSVVENNNNNNKYFDPKVFTFYGFIERANNNISNIKYQQIKDSFSNKYNNIKSYPQKIIENLDPDTPSQDSSPLPSICCLFICSLFFMGCGAGIYLLFRKEKDSNIPTSSQPLANITSDSSAPGLE